MRHLTYLGLLVACLVGTAPLELFLHARVYRRWRRTVLAVVPAAAIFTAWDIAAIHAGWWSFDRRYLVGIWLPGHLPMEELLFFLVVPVCAILTFESVRATAPRLARRRRAHVTYTEASAGAVLLAVAGRTWGCCAPDWSAGGCSGSATRSCWRSS